MTSICETGFLNCSQVIGQAIQGMTIDTTGSLILTLLFFIVLLFLIAIVFRIPIEYTMILVMPVLLGLMSYFKEFIGIGVVIIIYLAIILTKVFLIK